MKNKASLSMMEQMVMILIFALAAALCLQVFVKSDQLSQASQARDRAAVLCQSAAEAIRHNHGDFSAAAGDMDLPDSSGSDGSFDFRYDEDWTSTGGKEYAYILQAEKTVPEVSGLGKARVWVEDAGGMTLFELEVAWQEEVTAHG